MKTSAGTNATAGVGLARRLFSRVLSALSTLLQPAAKVLRSEQGRTASSCVPATITPQLGRVKPAALLMAAAMYAVVSVALLAPRPANAMSGFLSDLMAPYPTSNVFNMCGNCHHDFGGGGARFNIGSDYWIHTIGAAPATGSAFYQADADQDGVSNGAEWAKSTSATRPAQSAAAPLPANNWFPNFPDKDGDGCLQVYHRSNEVGMPIVPVGLIANGGLGGKGFVSYAPLGWDIDDNDPNQGCSASWTATAQGSTGDATPPAAVTNFKAASLAAAQIPLSWTAVGDDGSTGTAHSYDLRYTTQTLATAALKCGAGTTACNVRDTAHWAQMYDLIDSTVGGSGCVVATKTGTSTVCVNTVWNLGGPSSPLMRAFYEPLPAAAGAAQTYTLSVKGTVNPINTIVDGTTYWLATRVSDGVLKLNGAGTLESPSAGFNENISMSNIVAITAGTAGAAITSYTPTAPITASGTITANGLGLTNTNATQLVLTNSTGAVVQSLTSVVPATTSVSGTVTCPLAAGTYNLEARTSAAATKAAWVNAITVNCVSVNPPTISLISPSSRGQGATSQNIVITGNYLSGGVVTISGTGITINSQTVDSNTQITVNVSIASAATTGARTVTVTTATAPAATGTFTVVAGPAITSAAPPNAVWNQPYSHTVTYTGGTPPIVCAATGLPTGLTMNPSTCVISGTPTVVETGNGSITVTDTNMGTATQPHSINVPSAPPTVTSATTKSCLQNSACSYQIVATNNPTSYTATPLPTGMNLNATTGLISGTPTVVQTVNTVVRATNAYGQSAAVTVVISVTVPAVPVVQPPFTQDCTTGWPCSYPITATNSPTSYTASPLPAGMTLNATTGVISGTPTTVQTVSAVVRATNAVGTSTAATVVFTVALGTPIVSSPTTASGTVGTPFSYTIAASNSPTSFTASPLPAGLSLNAATGAITGTPTTAGTTVTAVTASNATGSSASVNVTITIAATLPGAPTLDTVTGIAGTTSVIVSFTPPASDGGAPITSYKVYCVPACGTGVAGAASPITVAGLNNNTSYTFTVKATNSVEGPASNAVTKYVSDDMLAPNVSASPVGGTYVGARSVTLTIDEVGGTVYYTLDGSAPTTASTVYTAPILVSGSTMLKYIGVDLAGNASPVSTELYLISDADLVMDTLTKSAATVHAGTSFTVDSAERNAGTTNMTVASNVVRFYLSLDNVITSGDIVMAGSRTVTPPLAAGAVSSTATTTVTVAKTTAPGAYYVGACADATNAQAESNETNNCMAATGTITVLREVNLVMTEVNTTAPNVGVGASFVVNNTEANTGATNMTVATNAVRFYLSVDNIITSADQMLTGLRSVSSLAAGTSSTSAATSVTVPKTVQPGTYYVGACADASNVQPETNEADNCMTATSGTIVVLRDVNLVMTEVSKVATSAAVGTSFVVNNTEANTGSTNMTVASNAVRFYLSADATITSTDSVLTGSRFVSSLASGANSGTAATSVKVPTTVAPGTYYVGACADASKVQPESNEGDNCMAAVGTIEITRDVNLAMSAVSKAAASVGVGLSFPIDSTENNVGTTNMTVTSNTVKFYLSTDATITTADLVMIGSRTVLALAAGANSGSATTTVTVPRNVAPGTYYVGACADAAGVQPETVETDNCMAAVGTISVFRDVDLVMSAVSTIATSAAVGTSITIDNTEANMGTTPMTVTTNTVRFYLSTDATITTSDTPLTGSRTVSLLAPGASSAASTTVTVPATVVPGTYYIGAIADVTNVQPETNEANNALAGLTITIMP